MSYSQNQEEKLLRQVFESPGGNLRPGCILSIGENDGVTLSNARALILGGWSAVLLEPDEIAYQRLQDLYKDVERVQTYKLGIADVTAVRSFYSVGDHLGKGDTGLLSTMNLAELIARFPGVPYTETQIDARTWKDFYTYAPVPRHFDVISIDAESFDLIILKQIDFNETKTKVVIVEWNSKDRYLYDQVMYPFGFTLLHVNGENLIYYR